MGEFLDTFRNSRNPKMVEGLICAHSWLRSSLMQSRDIIPSEELEISENIVLGINFTFPLIYLLRCISYFLLNYISYFFLAMLPMPRI